METSLKARELWGVIDNTKVKSEGNMVALLAYTKKENKALNLFVQSLSNNQLMTIRKEKIAKEIWNALANHHVNKGLANKIFLTCNLMS
jgi:hypothetical protein